MNLLRNASEKVGLYDEEYRILQPIWDLRIGYEEYLASPLFPVIFSVSFYFIAITPWMIFDLYGKKWHWIQKYKIQPDVDVTWPAVRKAILLTMWNQLLYIMPIGMLQWTFDKPLLLPPLAPTLWEFVWHNTVSLIIFDFEYFAWHAIHHKVRFLYKHVHSVHHQYHSPSSWVTQYLHPWELISVGVFTATTPRIFSSHPLTYLFFQQLSIVVSVEAHIGYEMPFGLHHLLPFYGGTIKHDMHHQKPHTNFAPFYHWCDVMLGSYCPGQKAGGVRPKALLDWEKKEKEAKRLKIETRRNARGHSNGTLSRK